MIKTNLENKQFTKEINIEVLDLGIETDCGIGQFIFVLKINNRYYRCGKEYLDTGSNNEDIQIIDVISNNLIGFVINGHRVKIQNNSNFDYFTNEFILELDRVLHNYILSRNLPNSLYKYNFEMDNHLEEEVLPSLNDEFKLIFESSEKEEKNIYAKINDSEITIKNHYIEKKFIIDIGVTEIYKQFIIDANKAFIEHK